MFNLLVKGITKDKLPTLFCEQTSDAVSGILAVFVRNCNTGFQNKNIHNKLILFERCMRDLDSLELCLPFPCYQENHLWFWNYELKGTAVQLDKEFRLPSKSQLRNTVVGQTWHFITQLSFIFWCYYSHSVVQWLCFHSGATVPQSTFLNKFSVKILRISVLIVFKL